MNTLLHDAQRRPNLVSFLIALVLVALHLAAAASVNAAAAARVAVLTVEGIIGPAAADYVERAIDKAAQDSAALGSPQAARRVAYAAIASEDGAAPHGVNPRPSRPAAAAAAPEGRSPP